MKTKKSQIEGLQAIVPVLVGIVIILTVGFLIMAEAKDQVIDLQSSSEFCQGPFVFNDSDGVADDYMCYNSTAPTDWNHTGTANLTYAYNGTSTIQSAIDDIPGWVPIIIITVIGAILLGIVSYFRSK